MTTVIANATIVTGDAGRTIHGGAVAVDGDRIVAVGPTAEVEARFPAAERIDVAPARRAPPRCTLSGQLPEP